MERLENEGRLSLPSADLPPMDPVPGFVDSRIMGLRQKAGKGNSPMIHSFTESFSVNFQNAFRYMVSLLLLWPAFFLTEEHDLLRAHVSLLRKKAKYIAVIALVNYAFQLCYTYSLFLLAPSMMSLLNQTQVVFGVFFAVIFFRDERAFIVRPMFLAGLLAALTGVVFVVVGRKTLDVHGLTIGILVVVTSAACWALLGSFLRKWVADVPPLLSICSVFTVVTPLFVATYAVAHGGFPMPHASAEQWLMLTASGLIAIGLGHSLFYRSVGTLGVSVSTSIGLLAPLLTCLISYVAFGDDLSVVQMVGAAILLVGCYLIVHVRFKMGST
jgi:drug/metabolite transporter (DMT)-like permease